MKANRPATAVCSLPGLICTSYFHVQVHNGLGYIGCFITLVLPVTIGFELVMVFYLGKHVYSLIIILIPQLLRLAYIYIPVCIEVQVSCRATGHTRSCMIWAVCLFAGFVLHNLLSCITPYNKKMGITHAVIGACHHSLPCCNVTVASFFYMF